ncbi:hypothetical protein [Leucobacter sp. gxy201]|uniref:hypothetical protein n=1 Tax=Leucobacter sp. gxy201 TaxID=2957200 RepID=UPI003DA15452
MTLPNSGDYAPSGSINIAFDSEEEAFRVLRDEVCADFARGEGTRIPGQLTKIEYVIAVAAIVAAFIGILICR